jgi:hypothetical protein
LRLLCLLRLLRLLCSRRTEERRKRRHREMEDDAADRALEQKQLAAEAAASSKKQHLEAQLEQEAAAEAPPDLDVLDGQQLLEEDAAAADAVHPAANGSAEDAVVKSEAAVKPEVDVNDGILQAMLAAASSIPPAAASPAHQLQPQPQQPRAAVARPGSKPQRKLGVSAMFGDDEEEDTKKRKLVPIKYSDEEMKAVEDYSQAVAEAAAGAAVAAGKGSQQLEQQQEQQQQQVDDGTVPVYPPGLDFTGRKAFLRQWMDTLPNSRDLFYA